MGIDPGIGIVGFGVIDTNGVKHQIVDAGVIKTKIGAPKESRLEVIYDDLKSLVEEFKPEAVSIEKLFFAQNVTTAMAVSEARGVILLVFEQLRVPIAEYTPLQIKSSLTGYGKAEKGQVQEMVKVLLGLKKRPSPDDAADALAAALTHAMA